MRSLWLSIEDRARGGWWKRFCRAWRRGGLVLLLLCAAVYLPGQTSLPPVDRDECRFAQASRQMFESVALPESQRDPKMHGGGLVVPMLVDVPRLNKPPLVYWLQTASAALFTWGRPLEDAIWMYRVPSVLSAIVAVFATWRLGLKMFDARAALLAAMLLAVAPMVVWDAHQARADQLLLACTTVCMGALWGVWRRRSGRESHAEDERANASESLRWIARTPWGTVVLFWLALGAGIMAKGPVTPLVVALAIVWLSLTTRSWRWIGGLRPVLGAVIVLACVAPWVWAVAQRQGGFGPYATLVWDEFFARGIRGSKEGHFAPPGTHTVLLAALFWPGSLLTLAGFIAAWKRARGLDQKPDREGGLGAKSPARESPGLRRGLLGRITRAWRGRDAEMFLVAWIVPMWVVFELSLAKLPHYTMPMYPAIALVSARMMMRAAARHGALNIVGLGIWTAIGVGLGLFAAIGAANASNLSNYEHALFQPALNIATVATISLICFGLLTWALLGLRASSILSLLLRAVMLVVLLGGFTISTVLPMLVPGSQSERLMVVVRESDPDRKRDVASVYWEESMVFATRGRGTPLPLERVLSWSREQPDAFLVLPTASLDVTGPDLRLLGQVRGGVSIAAGRLNGWYVLERRPLPKEPRE
ncbi:MAG: ArnT family glycosyltransferase [Phycisphaerales bacterium]